MEDDWRMKWFAKKKKHIDERIVSTQNKLYKETYNLVIFICMVSCIVKYFMYGSGLKVIATEIIILLASGLYYGIRSIQLGLYSDEVEVHDQSNTTFTKGVKSIIWSGILGVAFATFFGIRSATVYAEGTVQSLWYFILVFAVSLMMYIPFWIVFLGGSHFIANHLSRRNSHNDLDE